MAYPTIDKPYGIRPVNLIGGQSFAGSTRMIPIASGYSTSLYYGQLVQLNTTDTGTIIASSLTYTSTSAVLGTIGVFLGCEYTPAGGPLYGKQRYQYWLASTTATDAVAYVCDDPDTVFKAVAVGNPGAASASLTPIYLGRNFIGSNLFPVTVNSGSVITGDSLVGLCPGASNALTRTTAPFRVVEIPQDTALAVTTNCTTSGSSTTVTPSSMTGIQPGMLLTYTSSTGANYVTAVSTSTITVATAINLATATAVTFSGSPEVLVKWNFGYHSYYNAATA
jgi:hypothetical protein